MNHKLLLSTLALLGALWVSPGEAIAQITSANDSTGTRVNRNGDRFDINGGSLSGDGHNLFHSFEDFGLDANQIANFLSNPDIQNILGRIVGGHASVIDGLIQLSGGSADLYLINPAGVIFGANARLDVPGSFTATTANGIGFGDTWFNAVGTNDYDALVGSPSAFAFTMTNPGSILNAGELGVTSGQSLMLLGGTVINTGTLSAPGGQITVAAVPGENRVRISQDDALLSLELETLNTPQSSQINSLPFTPLELPALLSGGATDHASSLTVEPDGTIRLTRTNTPIPTTPGTTIASGTLTTDLTQNSEFNSHNSPTPPLPHSPTPQINVLGDRIGIFNATLSADSGTIRIGGDYQGQGTVFNASRTFVDSGSTITADALESGNGGRVIIWADETTDFYGDISARGGEVAGNGGFVEVSGRQDLIFRGDVDVSATNGAVGSLLLDPENITIVDGDGGANDAELADNEILAGDTPGATFTISETALEGLAVNADVTLEATNDITIENLTDDTLSLPTGDGAIATFVADSDNDGAGTFSMDIGDTITTDGGTLSIVGADVVVGGVDISDSGDLFLRGAEVDLIGGEDSVQLNAGSVEITSNPGQDIAVGGAADSGANVLDLTEIDLDALQFTDGNGQLTIGDLGNDGNVGITVVDGLAPLVFDSNLTLQTARGGIRLERDLTVDGAINFQASGDIEIINSQLDISSGIQLTGGAIAIGGSTIDSGGDFVASGAGTTTSPDGISIDRSNINATNANVEIIASDIILDGQISSGTGDITIRPFDENSTMGIGDTPFGDFNVSQDELTNLSTTGTVTIGNPITLDANGQEIALGEVRVRDVNLRDTPAIDDYDLTITGGAIRLFNSGSESNQSAIRLADNRTLQLISTEFIQQGDGTDVSVFGEEGSVLIDAATDIANNGDGFLEVQVRNIAARSRDGGDILLNLQLRNSTISNIGGIDGISTVGDGDIDIRTFGLRPDLFTVDAPVTANGSGDIRILARGSREDGRTIIAINAPITTVTGDIEIAFDIDNPPEDLLEAQEERGADLMLLQNNSIINLADTVTSESGSIEFWDPVIAEGGTVTTETGNIIFGDRLSGNQLFAIDAGSGTVEFNEAIGVNATGAIDSLLGLDIVAGDVTIQASANLGAEGLIIDSSGEVAIANTLTTFNGGRVDITAADTITANGITTDGGAIALSNADTITLRDTITINGGNLRVLESDRLILRNSATINTESGRFIYRNLDSDIHISGSGELSTTGGDIRLRGDDVRVNGAIALNTRRNRLAGGDITVRAGDGFIRLGDIDTSGRRGGIVIIDSPERIQTGTINTTGELAGGDVVITSETAATTGNIRANATNGVGGDIELAGDRITTGNLTTTGEDEGGDVSVIAEIAIQTGNIRTRGRIGDGGDVFLDPRRDIEVGFIDARGGTEGRGGDIIAFTERFFRAIDTFGNTISISSAGSSPNNNGIIDITHGGGPENPFEVGLLNDSAGNGTVGSITTGADAVDNHIISGDFSLGDIQITDLQAVPTPPPIIPPNTGDIILPDIEPVESEQEADTTPEFNNEFNENAAVASPSIIDLGVPDIDNQLTTEYQTYDPQIMPPPQSEIWIAHTPTISESEPSEPTTENAIVNQDISPIDPVEPGDNTIPEGVPQQPGQETFPDNASPNTENETESPTMNPPAAGEDPAIESEGELGGDGPASPAPDNDTETIPGQLPGSPSSPIERTIPQDDSRSSSSAGNTSQRSQVDVSLSEAQVQLRRIQQQTGIKPALVYAVFTPNPIAETFDAATSQETVTLDESGQNDTDQLELLLVTATGNVIRRPIPGTQRLEVERAVRRFRDILFIENTDTFSSTSQAMHQEWAQTFYQWLAAPLEQELEERGIDTIAFLMDEGLRALPLAALYDGDQYLVERYNIGLMPSLSLTNLEYIDINDADVLAMGASKFDRDALEPLPATEVETAMITDILWDGEAFMNEAFTYFNLRNQRQETPFGIVHLATHASFHDDEPEQAYIQLSDRPLRLDEIRELGWHNPVVELVVLSACDTAVGDRNTELGFAGFSALAGVKSTLASLWRVSDAGTLGLMVEFYQRLHEAPIKAEALREAQLAMLRGEAYIQDGTLIWSGGEQRLPIEAGLPENLPLAHPRFWAGFTMVGSPW